MSREADSTSPSSVPHFEQYDVAVVGGGVSGVYAAWELRMAQPSELTPRLRKLAERSGGHLRVGLFEADRRIGGRLYSKAIPVSGRLPNDKPQEPEIPDTVVELGGMRFLDPDHRRV